MHDSKTLVWILAICSSDNARAIGRTAVQLDAFNCMDSAALPRMALNITWSQIINIDCLSTMHWLNISNRINKISLTALVYWCLLMSVLCNDDRSWIGAVLMGLFANIGLFAVYFYLAYTCCIFLYCIRFIVFLQLFVRALHCIFFSLSGTALK